MIRSSILMAEDMPQDKLLALPASDIIAEIHYF
jgi:hypothetical protein